MRIATFNVNNIRRRLPNLLDWMRETSPDVVCLQELKATDAEFPVAAIREAGYEAIWRGQKMWNGVAILSRRKPIQTLSDLPGDPNDKQSRYIEAAVNGIVVASLYAPNGNPQPGPKFDYKLAWLRRLSVHAAELLAARVPVVLAGDVVPTDQDIYPSKSWDKDALVQPASRAAFAELTKQGWADAVRALHSSEPMYNSGITCGTDGSEMRACASTQKARYLAPDRPFVRERWTLGSADYCGEEIADVVRVMIEREFPPRRDGSVEPLPCDVPYSKRH
jgi:exodeoxyribonuclease-3